MSVLSDNEILDMINEGNLISKDFSLSSLTPNGYDVRIGSIKLLEKVEEHIEVPAGSGFYVSSMEYFSFPDTVMGEIWIRSSYSRKGIIGSFGAIDAGFSGNLTLYFYNASSSPIELHSGDRIAQVVFHRLEQSAKSNYEQRSGSYQFSKGITLNSEKVK